MFMVPKQQRLSYAKLSTSEAQENIQQKWRRPLRWKTEVTPDAKQRKTMQTIQTGLCAVPFSGLYSGTLYL